MKRLKSFLVAGEVVGGWVRHGVKVLQVDSECPATAQFHSAYYDPSRHAFVCTFEDESFDPVAPGCSVPLAPDVIVTEGEYIGTGVLMR